MTKLLIVSNRLPISVGKRKNKLHFQPSKGGLATGLGSFYKSCKSLWIGWPGISLEKIKGKGNYVESRLLSEKCYPVFLSRRDIDEYYYGFCNRTIWPLFHYFTQYTTYNKRLWRRYKRVNEAFCDTVIKVAEPGDIIWVHDYHLMLIPKLIRERLPDVTTGFFLHTPFPSFEVFRLLPWCKEIVEGLLGADLIGFHTYDYVRSFLESVRNLLGYEHTLGRVTTDSNLVKVDAFPMGIDYKRFVRTTHNQKVQKEIKRIRRKVGERRIILSIDRLDYTKGILQRLEAFDSFLEANSEYRKEITFILVAVPSRTRAEHYRLLKKQLDELVGKVNGKHGTIGWMPVWYIYRSLPFHNLVALYSVADISLVTPLRDGMNLMAKEFIATKTNGKGVLILSEMAGTAKELGEAIIVNPNDKDEIVEALKEALTMSEEEQTERNRIMQKRIQRHNVMSWAKNFIDCLSSIKRLQEQFRMKEFTYEMKKTLISGYSKNNKRLILLDYDGTLIPFAEKPEKAMPDDELLGLLGVLAREPKNEVVIVSGRDKDTLESWFGSLNLGLIAEHGAWIKDKERTWEIIDRLKKDWKEEIRPFLEIYVDRTPGSFIEEKEFSLVWHYRKADLELASIRARELKETLLSLTANLNLKILEGSKLIEIKNSSINKGQAVSYWISKGKWDFILAIGDDWTDEDVFTILPESAYSIKVGLAPSRAKFNIKSSIDIRSLLKELEGVQQFELEN